jgi:hypothetical protein
MSRLAQCALRFHARHAIVDEDKSNAALMSWRTTENADSAHANPHIKYLRNSLGDRPVILRKAALNELV